MKNYKISIIIAFLLLLTGSCKKFVSGYDKDPNRFTATIANQQMLGVLLENQFAMKADGLRIAMIWMNQATGTNNQYVYINNWNNVGNDDFNNPWEEIYTTLGQAVLLEDLATEMNNTQLKGLAKLYRAWSGGMAASLWGDVPFSQAGQYESYPDPVYDRQQEVFNQVQTLLDSAINDLSDNGSFGGIFPEKDIYFGGNGLKWIKIAHGLKARFYLHTGNWQNAFTEAQLGPASSSDDLIAQYGDPNKDPEGKWNPFVQFESARAGYMTATNSFSKDLLNGNRNNSKTEEIYRSKFNYYYFNLNMSISNDESAHGKFYKNMSLLTYGEMLLIQTEAKARMARNITDALPIYNTYRALLRTGYDTGGYENSANIKYDDYEAADFAAGGIENADNKTELQAFLREILEERYVYFIGDYEAFVDFARVHNDSDVPEYMELKSGISGAPLRFPYAQNEIDSNDNMPSTIPAVTDHLPGYN